MRKRTLNTRLRVENIVDRKILNSETPHNRQMLRSLRDYYWENIGRHRWQRLIQPIEKAIELQCDLEV